MQGNCSDADAAAALRLPRAVATSLLPLKPRQCLVLLPENFLRSNGGALWLDNLYLRLVRTKVRAVAAFFSVGSLRPAGYRSSTEASLYVTNITLHGDSQGSAEGVTASRNNERADMLVQGTAHVGHLAPDDRARSD